MWQGPLAGAEEVSVSWLALNKCLSRLSQTVGHAFAGFGFGVGLLICIFVCNCLRCFKINHRIKQLLLEKNAVS